MKYKYCKKCGKRLYKMPSGKWKHKKKLGQSYAYSPHC